jgi:GAF domain-containing protein
VPNVDEYPGHIACSSQAKSEIVIPALKNGEVVLVLDVDSEKLNDFGEADLTGLKQIMEIIEKII